MHKPVSSIRICVELGFVALCVLIFTPHIQIGLDPQWHLTLGGDELAFLLNSGQMAAIFFKKAGAIPLWNPFVGTGEPLIENLFSFVLNPLMTLPMLLFDPAQGVCISVLMHIVLMGVGGWALGYVLGLRSAGRVFLGLLLAGSGSMASAVGVGFYQIGLSMAYIPWILTGLVGTLALPRRWPVCLLAVATMLMLFAGSFWYVLATVLVGGVIVIAWVVSNHAGLNSMRRLVWAIFLTLTMSAVRLLPLVNTGLVSHLSERLDKTYDLFDLVKSYFTPTTPPIPGFLYDMFAYHFILPIEFAIVLLALWLLSRRQVKRNHPWFIPGVLLIVFFTMWAQEGTPIFRWLYQTLPPLQQLRSPVRIASVAAFWIAVLAATALDDILRWLRVYFRGYKPVVTIGARVFTGLLLVAALVSAFDVLINWTIAVSVEAVDRRPDEMAAVRYLRAQYPSDFVSLGTEGIPGSFSFYETFLRAATGNPNVITNGLPGTIGADGTLPDQPEYAVGGSYDYNIDLTRADYQPVSEAPRLNEFDYPILWRYPDALPYAFQVSAGVLAAATQPLTRQNVQPITAFVHNISSVQVMLDHSEAGNVLVIQEIDYPGWVATVNGQPAKIESASGKLAVLLPSSTQPVTIRFEYRPPLLYIGAAISFVGMIVFTFYALKLDKHLIRLASVIRPFNRVQ